MQRRVRVVRRRMPVTVQRRIRTTLKKGELTKHGYSIRKSDEARHRALAKAVKEDGALTVYKRLNLLYVWNKNNNPDIARVAKEDMEWVGKTYGIEVDGYSFR